MSNKLQGKTLLLRQVHPNFVQADTISQQVFSITSQVFTPTHKDNNKLSVYNGDKFSAEDSLTHFHETPQNKSIGVVAVSCDECNELQLDTYEDNTPFEGHSNIDFLEYTKGQITSKAKVLKNNAIARGWLYQKNGKESGE